LASGKGIFSNRTILPGKGNQFLPSRTFPSKNEENGINGQYYNFDLVYFRCAYSQNGKKLLVLGVLMVVITAKQKYIQLVHPFVSPINLNLYKL